MSAGSVRASFKILLIVLSVLLLLPFAVLCWRAGWQGCRLAIVTFFYRIMAGIIGLRIATQGSLDSARPLLLVANHCSYLDVFVLGANAPCAFTPKREVRSWPVIGFLCVLADCVFVERRRSHMQEAQEAMSARLAQGKIVCIFPEGTTNDTLHMKPFKSGFFSLAESHGAPVQPVSIHYTQLNGKPIPDAKRDQIAWVGDDAFFAHFLRVLSFRSVAATLSFHPTQTLAQHGNRKALSHHCEAIIADALSLPRPSEAVQVGAA